MRAVRGGLQAVWRPGGGYARRISHSSPDLVTRIARPLLAAMFVAGGLDAVRRPASKLPKADAVIEPLEDAVGITPIRSSSSG